MSGLHGIMSKDAETVEYTEGDCTFPNCEYIQGEAWLAHLPHDKITFPGYVGELPDGGFHENSFCHAYRKPGEEFVSEPSYSDPRCDAAGRHLFICGCEVR